VHAKFLARLGAVDKAERLAREALKLVAPTDALNRHGDSLLALGEILRLQGRENEADGQIREALRLYEQKGNLVSAERAKAMLLEGAIPE
jgi:tetratricopeptide (TPR) repeat protein